MSQQIWPSLARVLFTAAFALLLAGCGPKITKFHMRDALSALRADYGAPVVPAGADAAGDINVVVLSPPSIGCGGPGACIPLEGTSMSGAADELHADLARRKIPAGFVYYDVGPTAVQILRERLGEHFRNVTVTLGTAAPPGAIPVKLTPFPWTQNMSRMVMFQLLATPEAGAPRVGVGVSQHVMSRGHFAWAIPLALVMFPHGIAWVPPIVWSIRDKHTGIATAEAMDRAATSLAKQLAEKAKTTAGR